MAGRPSKRTPEREARLLEALRAGNTRHAACNYAGISEDILAIWLRRFSDFSDAVQKAEADSEVSRIARIALAGQHGVWQADAWWLERRRPEDYARRDRIDLEVYVRQRAHELGLDENQALEAVKPRLKLVSGG